MIRLLTLVTIASLLTGITSCNKAPVGNNAPTISISSPADNLIMNSSGTLTLTVLATDTDGAIDKVEFFNGSSLLGTSFSPFTFILVNPPAGSYKITAKATDNRGAVTTSAAINVTVNIAFTATLNGANERPNPVASAATGSSIASYNVSTKILSITTNYTGLTPTAGHLHTGAPNVSGPVTFGFPAPLTSPIVFNTPVLTATQESDLLQNLYYVNLHTPAFPGGEIRGQLIKQ